MGERTSHTPGTFSWADVGTNDLEGAKAFYSALPAGSFTVVRDPQGAVFALFEGEVDD